VALLLNFGPSPLLIALAIDEVVSIEKPSDFNEAIAGLLDALALHLVLAPVTYVFRLITRLLEAPHAMEHPQEELSFIEATIREHLVALPVILVSFECAFVDGPIWELKGALPVFLAVLPFSGVGDAVGPLADSDAAHLPVLPLPIVLPALLPANEQAGAMLVALDVLTFVVVAVGPLPNAKATRLSILELPREAVPLHVDHLSVALHLALDPVALVLLAVFPGLDAVALRDSFLDLSNVLALLRVSIDDLCVLSNQVLLGLEI